MGINIKKQLKNLQYRIVYNKSVKQEEQVTIIQLARARIRELENKLDSVLGEGPTPL